MILPRKFAFSNLYLEIMIVEFTHVSNDAFILY